MTAFRCFHRFQATSKNTESKIGRAAESRRFRCRGHHSPVSSSCSGTSVAGRIGDKSENHSCLAMTQPRMRCPTVSGAWPQRAQSSSSCKPCLLRLEAVHRRLWRASHSHRRRRTNPKKRRSTTPSPPKAGRPALLSKQSSSSDPSPTPCPPKGKARHRLSICEIAHSERQQGSSNMMMFSYSVSFFNLSSR